jgi:hypothetical protein
MTGLLSNTNSQAQSYWVLGSIAAATAVFALLAPGAFAGTIFQAPTDALVDTMTRMTGATLLASAATKYTLKVCDEGGRGGGLCPRQGRCS